MHDLGHVAVTAVSNARRDVVDDAIARAKAMQSKADTTVSVLQRLSVETVSLVPRPTSIGHYAHMIDLSDPTAQMQQDASYTFFGIWFAVAAAVRFQRPLRRKRLMDAELAKMKQAEAQKFQQDLLQHVGSTADVKRAARDLLWKQIQQSTAEVRSQRSMLDRRHAEQRVQTAAGMESSNATTGSSSGARPVLPPSKPLSLRQAMTVRTRVGVSQHSALRPEVMISPRPFSRERTAASYEQKTEARHVQQSATKIAQGVSASGSLALTVAQHANSADPTRLAAYMLKSLGHEPQRPATVQPPPTAPMRPPLQQRVPKVAPLSTGNIAEDGVAIPCSSRPTSASYDSGTPTVSLVATSPGRVGQLARFGTLGRLDSASLNRHSASSPVKAPGRVCSNSNMAGVTPQAFHTPSPSLAPSMRAESVSLSVPSPHSNHHNTNKTASYIRARREASAFLPLKTTPVVVSEADFVDVPVPKTDHSIVLAYPPRPAHITAMDIPGSVQPRTQLEAQFIKRVVANAYHDDVLQRLQHAEACRDRDRGLKKLFLDARTHQSVNQPNGSLTVHDVMRDLNVYVSSKRQQDGRRQRHQRRQHWFHQFYEAIIEKCPFEDIEPLLMLMEEQVNDEFASLEHDCFMELFQAATWDALRLPSVQFFLCHVAVAYQVPYITFRELLELRHTPYLLQGNGETFGGRLSS